MNNKIQALDEAIREASRFIKKATEAQARLVIESNERYKSASTKEFAAAKRASMDLTRSLVKVRRGE